MIPHHFYNHQNENIIVGVFTPMGRTLDSYLRDNGIWESPNKVIRTKIVMATVMADVIRGFLTMFKYNMYSGAIHPSKIYFSQEYMNAFLHPTFGMPQGQKHEKDVNRFPYYS